MTMVENPRNDHPICFCEMPAALRCAGPTSGHPGEQFWTCPKPRGDSCKFFRWCNEELNSQMSFKKSQAYQTQSQTQTSQASQSQGQGQPQSHSRINPNSTYAHAKRRLNLDDNEESPNSSSSSTSTPSPSQSRHTHITLATQAEDFLETASNICVANSQLSNNLGKTLDRLEKVVGKLLECIVVCREGSASSSSSSSGSSGSISSSGSDSSSSDTAKEKEPILKRSKKEAAAKAMTIPKVSENLKEEAL